MYAANHQSLLDILVLGAALPGDFKWATKRSIMNVPFILADAGLDGKFLAEAQASGLANLKGHRSVGGMRASIYNAVSEEAVDALIAFMAEFERVNG